MSENCNHDCAKCGAECAERTELERMLERPNPRSHIRKVIGVVSGKGGVGKSLVTSLLAVLTQRGGLQAAVLDADITGPSIPKVFGIHERAAGEGSDILPAQTASGIKLISINLLLEHDSDPVIWRGPVIAGAVKQFWTDVRWGDVDYMFVDMPPGTGDVPLTVFQSLPVDGVVVVASPQELVGMIVEKAVNMAKTMNVPVLGLVENMAWFQCPTCHERHHIFGKSHLEELSTQFQIKCTAQLPMDPLLADLCDQGEIESFAGPWLDTIIQAITDF